MNCRKDILGMAIIFSFLLLNACQQVSDATHTEVNIIQNEIENTSESCKESGDIVEDPIEYLRKYSVDIINAGSRMYYNPLEANSVGFENLEKDQTYVDSSGNSYNIRFSSAYYANKNEIDFAMIYTPDDFDYLSIEYIELDNGEEQIKLLSPEIEPYDFFMIVYFIDGMDYKGLNSIEEFKEFFQKGGVKLSVIETDGEVQEFLLTDNTISGICGELEIINEALKFIEFE